MSTVEQTINTTTTSTTDMTNETIEYVNPFYVGRSGGNLLNITTRDMYETYQKCIAVSLKDGTYINDVTMAIYEKVSSINELKDISKYFDLVECNIKIMTNYSIKKLCNIIDAHTLNNIFNTNYRHSQIIVPFFNVYTSNVRNYVSVYGSSNSIDDVMKTVGMVQIYNVNRNSRYDRNTSDVMQAKFMDMNDGFWKVKDNVSLPFEGTFNDRSFKYNGFSLHKLNSKTFKRVDDINKLDQLIESNVIQTNENDKIDCSDYLAGINDIADNFGNNDNVDYLGGLNEFNINTNNKFYDIKLNDNNDNVLKTKPLFDSAFENLNKAIRTDPNRRFYIETYNDPVSKGDMVDIYSNLSNEKEKVKFLTSLMTSKKHCHLILNNKNLLELVNADNLFAKYRQMFSIVMGYSWATFCMNEALQCTRSTKFSDYAFDIDTAHLLPSFPTCFDGLKHSPYFFTPLSDDCIDYENNLIGMHSFKDHEKYNGVTTREEAVRRFNIFCTGDPGKELIDFNANVKWSISGSIIPACIKKMTPLFEKCNVDNEFNPETGSKPFTPEQLNVEKWKTYFDEYYGKSDIDVMVETNDCIKFINFGTKIINSLCERFSIDKTNIDVTADEKGVVVVTPHFFSECLDDLNSVLETEYTEDQLIREFSKMTFTINGDNENVSNIVKEIKEKYFYPDYKAEKKVKNENFDALIKESEFEFNEHLMNAYTNYRNIEKIRYRIVSYSITKEEYSQKDTDICFFVNDFRDEENKVDESCNYMVYKFGESVKCKIHFNDEDIKRPIEIFMVHGPDPFKTVGRFHLPIVRCYYQVFNNKPDFFILPSCISSTHVPTSDMIYFAGSKNPCEIVLKYLTRGAGIILNKKELRGVYNYCKLVDNTNGMYAVDNPKLIFGPREHNSRVYCPGFYNNTNNNDNQEESKMYRDVNVEYIRTKEELYALYDEERKTYGYNGKISLNDITCIDSNGNITPYESWVVDCYLSGYN